MKKLFSRLPKKLIAAAVVAGIVLGVTTSGTALIGGDREVRTYSQGTPGFNHVTFNSFTNVPNIGDERDFFTGKISEAPNGFYDPMNQLRAGDEILMRVYVHNNADSSLNASGQGVAKNTQVRVSLPSGLAEEQTARAFISADNAAPKTIEDTLSLNGQYPFEIEYVPGSARVKTNAMDVALSDAIVTTGVKIGDDKLDGNLNGCFEYVALVTLKVKVKAPSYSLDKKVRLNGASTFTEDVQANPGQKVDFVLAFKNVGSTNLSNVVLGDRLPAGLTYVPGTTELNSGHTNNQWTKVANDNLLTGGIDIGNYGPGGAAYVRFTAIVDGIEKLKCGKNNLVNTGFAKPKEHGAIEDKATVKVDGKECKEPTYICESVKVEKLGGRKVRVTVKAPASNGATFKNVTINFGDGTQAKVTDQLVNEYTYAKDETYHINAKVTFTVNGEDVEVSSDACAAKVSFESKTEKCPIPGKEHLPKDSPDCKEAPGDLPKTGAGSMIGIVAIVTLMGAVAHNIVSRRMAA